MAFSSLIGFGLVIISVSLLSSAVLGVLFRWFKGSISPLGPWARRRLYTLALILPPLLGLGVSLTIAASNLLDFARGQDHCLGHSHHLHLCPVHGANWLSIPWAVAAVAFFGTFVTVRVGQTAWAHIRAQYNANQLRANGSPISGVQNAYLVPSDNCFAFTAGVLHPTIIVSMGAWNRLETEQQSALLAHEGAHIAHGDLWKRAMLGLASSLAAPGFTHVALESWVLASEQLCDRNSLRSVSKPSIVASAILSLVQAKTYSTEPSAAVFAAQNHVTERVQTLFNQTNDGKSTANIFTAIVAATASIFGIGAVFFAESLHHIVETILG